MKLKMEISRYVAARRLVLLSISVHFGIPILLTIVVLLSTTYYVSIFISFFIIIIIVLPAWNGYFHRNVFFIYVYKSFLSLCRLCLSISSLAQTS